MIIWKISIAMDKMKIIIRLFDYSIDFRIIEYIMPKYVGSTLQVAAQEVVTQVLSKHTSSVSKTARRLQEDVLSLYKESRCTNQHQIGCCSCCYCWLCYFCCCD